LFIKKLKVSNFRNYGEMELSAAPGINVIYGKNGLGKTNIIEAMFLCAIGKSFRAAHNNEMIKIGEELGERGAKEWFEKHPPNTDPHFRWTDANRWDKD
jgi:DNA replication and repair protein RecF